MKLQNELPAQFLDILFKNRNKAYGAYELRVQYPQRLKKSLVIMLGIVLLCLLFVWLQAGKPKATAPEIFTVTGLVEIKKPADKPRPILKEKTVVKTVQAKQQEYLPPRIKPDHKVAPASIIHDLNDAVAIGNKQILTGADLPLVYTPVADTGISVAVLPIKKETAGTEPEIYTKVEIEAAYPGGNAAWRKYISNALDPEKPIAEGAAPGMYTVMVYFIVDKEGNIKNVQAETGHGFSMEQQAIKAIAKGPKWKPALQNGVYVSSYKRQPISFVITE